MKEEKALCENKREIRVDILIQVAMYMVVGIIWLFWLMPSIGFENYFKRYPIPLTMVPGGFVSGFTICGGGAVSFPVFCKVLKLDPMMARDFALGIQSFGMTCAAITIVIKRIKIEKNVAILCTIGSAVGLILGNICLVPMISSENMKILFSLVIAAFGVSLFFHTFFSYNNRKYIVDKVQNLNLKKRIILIVIGFVGGIFTSILGTGADIIAFSIVTILFKVNEKVLNPTSDIIMALSSVMGLVMRLFFFGGINQDAAESFPLAVPVVIIMAPIGAVAASKIKRLSVVKFLLFFIAVEICSTFYSMRMGAEQMGITLLLFIGLLLFYLCLFKISEKNNINEEKVNYGK